MTYYLLGITVVLALFLLANMVFALLATCVWKVFSVQIAALPLQVRSTIIFSLRVFPATVAVLLVAGFVLPGYWLYEPYNSGEVVSAKLALTAAASLAGILLAAFRIFQVSLATRRLTRNWLSDSEEIVVAGIDLPVYRISHPFPVLAIVGIFNPKIFVGENVLASLSDQEFRVAIAHEYGHLKTRDNLRSMLLRVCRDLLIIPIGRDIDNAWAHNAEALADDFAAKNANRGALDLASALVKISQIVPDGTMPTMPAGAYFIGDSGGDISSRIKRLVSVDQQDISSGSMLARLLSIPGPVWTLGIAILLILHFADQRILFATHQAVEHFVRVVQ